MSLIIFITGPDLATCGVRGQRRCVSVYVCVSLGVRLCTCVTVYVTYCVRLPVMPVRHKHTVLRNTCHAKKTKQKKPHQLQKVSMN